MAVLHELRHAARLPSRAPALTLAAALTFAVGIGAVTTAGTLVHGILLAPLPYPVSGRLVRLYAELGRLRDSPNPRLAAIWNRIPVSYLDASDWRRRSHTLTGIGLFAGSTLALGGSDGRTTEPREVSAARVEPELLRALGVQPALGRWLADEDRRKPVVLLSHGLWTEVFGRDERVLGRSLRLDGAPHTVVGVMPPGFDLPGRDDALWLPLAPSDDDLSFRNDQAYGAIGRLAPGVSLEQARSELDRIAADLAAEHPETNADSGVRLTPLLDTVVGDRRRVLELTAAAAAVVLLVACVNVAHLLLGRSAERRRELALRLALGAGRLRLVLHLAAESLLLAVIGGTGGLALALAAHRALPALVGDELPRLGETVPGSTAAFIAAGASLVAALLAGLLPAASLLNLQPREASSEGRAGAAGGSPGRRGSRGALVVAEVALTLALVSGAALIAATWLRLGVVDPGFRTEGVLTQEVRLPAWRYRDDGERRRFGERLLVKLEALPGVRSAALASRLPVAGPATVQGFRIEGRDPKGGDWTRGRSATVQSVSPGYFRLLGIPVVAGRAFEAADASAGPEARRVVMIDRSLAERHWPGEDPIGARIVLGDEVYTVVGVFEDVLHGGLGQRLDEGSEDLLVEPWSRRSTSTLAALVATSGPPEALAAAVRGTVRSLDPEIPLPPAAPLAEVVARDLAAPRSRTLLIGLPAVAVLALALIGTFGVTAHEVSRRRREIGIRMALGADGARIRRSILGRLLALAAGGVTLGGAGAVWVAHLAEGLVYGVKPGDPTALAALAASALLLVITSVGAGYLPARRASRLDPARTLREE